MPRYSNDEIDRIKQEVSIIRLAESYGFDLKKHGNDFITLCPWHNDTSPSLVFTIDNNLWHCLGACNEGGNNIQFVMKVKGISFRHALELLCDGTPDLAAKKEKTKPVKHGTNCQLGSDLDIGLEDAALLQRVVTFYHNTLKKSPEALGYLDKRGLKDAEMIDHFKIGFANRSLCYRLPNNNRQAGAAIRGQLQKIGILRSETGHEAMRGSIVVPVIENGIVTELYGRKILRNLRKGTPAHLYLPGPHKGVFNIEAFKASKEIILAECLIDAMTFWTNGYRNVTASYGTPGFNNDHLTAFKEHGIERVLIAYDNDDAGNKAVPDVVNKLTSLGIECFRIGFPAGMDANEYAVQMMPAADSLGQLIRKAQWLGKGKTPSIVANACKPPQPENKVIMQEELATKQENSLPSLAAEPLVAEPVVPTPLKPATPLPASPQPQPPKDAGDVQEEKHQILFNLGDRCYRVRDLDKNKGNYLKVNIMAQRNELFHVDTIDLRMAKQRQTFIQQAAAELGYAEDVIKRDLGKCYRHLEAMQDKRLELANKKPEMDVKALTEDERKEALSRLKAPDLVQRILQDFNDCGVVGEEENKLVGFLAVISRKQKKPLAVLIQSNSGTGKSAMMDAILDFMPPEDCKHYSAMTGQALFYLGQKDLQAKILAIDEEEGIRQAAYALKLLQSQGYITIASTQKDNVTGELKTQPYRVDGPIMLFMTTTSNEVDEELLNRCLVLIADESRRQTRAIHERQRFDETLEGLWSRRHHKHIIQQQQNMQRLLRPLEVINPYAQYLAFMDEQTRTRRDHMKYLALLRSYALLHQYQRPIKKDERNGEIVEFIEVTLDDIETVNRLAHETLGRSLDEVPPQTRHFLRLLRNMVLDACAKLQLSQIDFRFNRRQIREHTGWRETQTRMHLDRLVELEYVLPHRGRRGQSFEYELLWQGEGEDGRPFILGLADVEKLRQSTGTTASSRGIDESSRSQIGSKAAGSRTGLDDILPDNSDGCKESAEIPKTHITGQKNNTSYRNIIVPAAPTAEGIC